jgi:hypothetical protein
VKVLPVRVEAIDPRAAEADPEGEVGNVDPIADAFDDRGLIQVGQIHAMNFQYMPGQNVSAILGEIGHEWIDGYTPLEHYQHDLRRAVLSALQRDHRIGEQLAEYESSPVPGLLCAVSRPRT